MRGCVYGENLKKKAEKLRASGKTYKEIRDLLNIPKSTLSNWFSKKFSGIFDREKQLSHLAKIRPLAADAKKREKEKKQAILIKKISKEVKNYPLKNIGLLKSILSALYWAEGAKHEGVSGLRFVNTDPKLAKFYIALLRKCYKLDEAKFKIRLHLHYYHGIREAKKFWSDLLNIPLNQFTGIFIKKRSRKKRFRKNFMGICFINYSDSNIRKELLELTNQLCLLIKR